MASVKADKSAPKKVRLNDAEIARLPTPEAGKRKIYWDEWVTGFGVRITSNRAVSFFVAKRAKRSDTSPTFFSLGTFPAEANKADRERAVAVARKAAKDLLVELAAGVDPRERQTAARREQEEKRRAEAEQAERARNTFKGVAEHYITRVVDRKRKGSEKTVLKSAADIRNIIRREFIAHWGSKPVAEVTPDDVKRRLLAINRKSPSGARQALVWIRLVFEWATVTGPDDLDDDKSKAENAPPYLDDSPAFGLTPKGLKLDKPKSRKRVLSDAELALVWLAVNAEWNTPMGRVYALYVKVLMATAGRRKEISQLQRSELDGKKREIFLSAERSKNDDPRIMPLSVVAADLIAELPIWNAGDFIFSTTNGEKPISGFSKAKAALDARIKELNGGKAIAPWRLHDLRRTARTNFSALPIPHNVRELMLGHAQDELEGTYDLHAYQKEQRAGFELWAARLQAIVNPPKGNVVTLQRAAMR
jgi:integrase